MKVLKAFLVASFFLGLFSGCASVNYAEKPASFVPQDGKGLVFFYREKAFVGSAISYKVKEKDAQIGALSNGTFFVVNADAGDHTYTANTEATESVNLKVEAGKSYYIRGGISMGIMAGRPSLIEVTAAEAESKIGALKYTDINAVKSKKKK